MQPRDTIAALAVELEQRALAFEWAHDPRCVFARAYSELSRVLANALPYAGFRDPTWVANLAVRFAGYYTHAVREYDAGKLARGAWTAVFRASDRGHTSVREELMLGLTAHIVNDLPRALCDVGLTSTSGASHVFDFHVMNNVLGQSIERVQLELSRRYDPLLGVLDRLGQRHGEILTNYGLRMSRAAAWYNAQRLLEPALKDAALEAIAHSPALTMRELLNPPLPSLRFAMRVTRRLARITRRWPTDTRVKPAYSHRVSEPHVDLKRRPQTAARGVN